MTTLLYIGIVQAVFTGTIILLQKKVPLSNKILAAWLYTVAFSFVYSVIRHDYSHLITPTFRGMEVEFTFGPLLYLYTRSLINENPKVKATDFLHFIPFIGFKILFSTYEGNPSSFSDFFANDGLLWLRMTYGITFLCSVTFYPALVFYLLKKHRKNIQNHYSFNNANITLHWIRVLTWGFLIGSVLTIISFQITNTYNDWIINPEIFMVSFYILLAYAVSFYGFKQPDIFLYRVNQIKEKEIKPQLEIQPAKIIKEEPVQQSKYQRSGLKDENADKYLKQIIAYMENEQAYLNGDLTIQDISDKLNIPRHHITQVLNEQIGKNFYHFVNEYRMEEVKKRLLSDEYKRLTLLAIAYDCGFNSKSAFNMVFKQSTGLTPTAWKKQQLKNKA